VKIRLEERRISRGDESDACLNHSNSRDSSAFAQMPALTSPRLRLDDDLDVLTERRQQRHDASSGIPAMSRLIGAMLG
jgi:hypothetical protein